MRVLRVDLLLWDLMAMAIVEVNIEDFEGNEWIGNGTDDILKLIGDGDLNFNFSVVKGYKEIILSGDINVNISADQLPDIPKFTSESSDWARIEIFGQDINLKRTTFSNIEYIVIADDNAYVTVSNLATALQLNAYQ